MKYRKKQEIIIKTDAYLPANKPTKMMVYPRNVPDAKMMVCGSVSFSVL